MSAERVLEGQLPLPISLDVGATFDNYYVGPNGAAVDALKAAHVERHILLS